MAHETRDYIKQLRQHGFRVTLQRLIVLDSVCDIGGHATLPTITQRVEELNPTIATSTIYRALDVLVEAELVVSSEIEGVGKVFEIADDTPHHHLICKRCGDVQVLSHTIIQPFLERICGDYGFYVETNHLSLSGLCNSCFETID